jgi:hypothetical protein
MTNQEFIKSEIYKDIGDYKNMTLLALSKKLPYWLKIYNDKDCRGNYNIVIHLRNYCRDCDKEKIFIVKMLVTAYGNYKPLTTYNETFWIYYRENFRKLYFEALNHYKETSKANEEVQCPCGGHYTKAHRAKHFKTKKHLKYESVLQI